MDVQIGNIDHRLKELGCSAEIFCALAGVPSSRWSRVQRGLTVLHGDEIVRLSKIVRTLEDIQDAAMPIPINFKDIESVRRLFEHRVEAGITWTPVLNLEKQDKTNN